MCISCVNKSEADWQAKALDRRVEYYRKNAKNTGIIGGFAIGLFTAGMIGIVMLSATHSATMNDVVLVLIGIGGGCAFSSVITGTALRHLGKDLIRSVTERLPDNGVFLAPDTTQMQIDQLKKLKYYDNYTIITLAESEFSDLVLDGYHTEEAKIKMLEIVQKVIEMRKLPFPRCSEKALYAQQKGLKRDPRLKAYNQQHALYQEKYQALQLKKYALYSELLVLFNNGHLAMPRFNQKII